MPRLHCSLPVLLFACACWGVACTSSIPSPAPDAVAGPWSDANAWAVLDAQDHRDTKRLIAFLTDSSAMIRAKAALALASAGDSTAAAPLLKALSDADPTVRSNAAFAFGFCGDSLSVHQFVERYSAEENAAVRGRIAEAMGRVGGSDIIGLLLRRSLSAHADSLGVLLGLYNAALNKHSDTAAVHFALKMPAGMNEDIAGAAAQLLFRSGQDALKPFAAQLLERAKATPFDEPLIPLLGTIGKTLDPSTKNLLDQWAIAHPSPRIRVAALHALGRFPQPTMEHAVWACLDDTSSAVRTTALEQMQQWRGKIDGERLWKIAQEHADYAIKIPLYALVLKHGEEGTRGICRSLLNAMAQQDLGPYLNAALVKARYGGYDDLDTLRTIMQHGTSAVVRQAAFEQWTATYKEFLKNAEVDQRQRNKTHTTFMRTALLSGDAGLVASACDAIVQENTDYLKLLLDSATVATVRASLHPIRDLETVQLLNAAIAKRDGKPAPKHKGPPFNHPIDASRLKALGNGQRYRITTSKGEIIVDTEPELAPGSCTAFDSLATAGFYDGKYFHRVVPDFVAQGGCPRGDGYGAMDWTQRTEIGLSSFTTGAVGLASAGKDTESCQFFIMLAPAPHLDGRYTRFAHVVSGMDVAQRLAVGDRIVSVVRMK